MGTEVLTLGAGPGAPQFFPIPGTATALSKARARANWNHVLVTADRIEARRLIGAALYRVVIRGASPAAAERAIVGFRRYVVEVVDGQGTMGLCLGMVVDTLCAGMAAGWVPERISDLLVKMQQQLDMGTSSLDDLAATIGRVRRGGSVAETLTDPRALRAS